jgi:putative membrane protein
MKALHAVAVLALAGTVAACGTNPNDTAGKAAPLTDADVAGIVVAANSIDADAGEVAASRATSAEVRAFAQTMVRDHRAVNQQAGQLVQKLGITPAENAVTRQLHAEAKAAADDLQKRSGSDFDRAYLAREVAFHQAVIAAIDNALLPSVQSTELKGALEGVRPAIVAHLEHAQRLVATVK